MTTRQRNIVLKHLGHEVETRRRRMPERHASPFQDIKDSAALLQEEIDAFEAAAEALLAVQVEE